IREFVIAGHGNLEKVRQMFAENPKLLNASYRWNENDTETAVQAAAQVGSADVAQFLLKQGAPLEICTAAMLGMQDEVVRRLNEDPRNAHATGAHGIPLLPHAVWSEIRDWFNWSSNEVRNPARLSRYRTPYRGAITQSSSGCLIMQDPMRRRRIFKERLH